MSNAEYHLTALRRVFVRASGEYVEPGAEFTANLTEEELARLLDKGVVAAVEIEIEIEEEEGDDGENSIDSAGD